MPSASSSSWTRCSSAAISSCSLLPNVDLARSTCGTQGNARTRASGTPASNQLPAFAVKRQDDSQQSDLPFRRAIHVLFVKGALGQETVLHDFGDEQDQALRVGQDVRPDQFDDLLEAFLALEERQRFGAQFAPIGRTAFPTRR